MPTPAILERLSPALAYAYTLHKDDVRKETAIPYLSHLLNVSGLVLWDGGDEDEAIAGLLHDALEDHPDRTSRAEIESRFGPRAAMIVAGCTDTPENYRGGTKPPWRERKEGYLKHLLMADACTRRVSMADKLDNARSVLADLRRIGDRLWDRFNAGKADQLWDYRALVDTFRAAGSSGLLFDDLDYTVTQIQYLCAASPDILRDTKRAKSWSIESGDGVVPDGASGVGTKQQVHGKHRLKPAGSAYIEAPTEKDLLDAIDKMRPEEDRGFIVVEKPGGSYAQSAGGDGKYTVECRAWLDDRFETFQHFVAGKKGMPVKKEVRIPTSSFNSVLVRQNECLSLSDVKEILKVYLKHGTRHPGYDWRDTTLNF